MSDHDSQLMLRAADGDDEAFRELFDLHYPRAVNIAYRCLADTDLAEDAAMEAFARIYEKRRSYRARAKFTTFLYRVVVNTCLNHAKRRRIVELQPLDPDVVPGGDRSDPAVQFQQTETADAVRGAVMSLPPNQRMALILTRYEQMSYRDAAESMGVSIKALESLLHRAKTTLRDSLRDTVLL